MENKKREASIRHPIVIGFCLLVLQLAALFLEILPNAVMVPFASGPNKWVTFTYSYFDPILPFGAVEWFPILTAGLTITVILLCIIALIQKKGAIQFKKTIFICYVIMLLLSFMPLFRYDAAFLSVPNYCITAITLISIALFLWANIRFSKNHDKNASIE